MANISLYENYHKNIKLQKRLITLNDFTYKNLLSNIIKYIPKAGAVLDIGSATGTISFFLASIGFQVDGIELSKRAVKYANHNKKNFELKNVNFVNTSLENYKTLKKYDLVTCFEVLEHLSDDKVALTIMNNFMKKNSILAISVPSQNAPLYRLGLLKKFDKSVGHLRRYKLFQMYHLLNEAGFKVIKSFKTEGPIRNLIFTNKLFGLLVKATRFTLVNRLLTFFDNLTLNLFGESQLILIARKK